MIFFDNDDDGNNGEDGDKCNNGDDGNHLNLLQCLCHCSLTLFDGVNLDQCMLIMKIMLCC